MSSAKFSDHPTKTLFAIYSNPSLSARLKRSNSIVSHTLSCASSWITMVKPFQFLVFLPIVSQLIQVITNMRLVNLQCVLLSTSHSSVVTCRRSVSSIIKWVSICINNRSTDSTTLTLTKKQRVTSLKFTMRHALPSTLVLVINLHHFISCLCLPTSPQSHRYVGRPCPIQSLDSSPRQRSQAH